MATLVTVRWHTPPPNSVDERLIIGDDGRARLDVLRPRTIGDAVSTYEGAVEESEVRELTAAGADINLDGVVQDAPLAALAITADQVAQRLLSSPLAVAQFFARPIGAVPPLPQTLALGVLGLGLEPVEFQLDLAQCEIQFSAGGTEVASTPLPEVPMGFQTADAEGLGGVRQRASVAPDVLGVISVPLVMPDGVDHLSVRVAGGWFLPGEAMPDEFEARTASQPL